MKEIIIKLLESWADYEGNVHTLDDIMRWIDDIKETTHVRIDECSIHDSKFWFYDDYNGEILNIRRSFFSITGMRLFHNNRFVYEQPIIIQPEIGYLGIICKEIDGVLNFLMQAKIEPGNVNCVQISPTIQATKSNFIRAHGGRLPTYFQYFENASDHVIIYDQIQSEQAARFYKKRNRNIIICIEDEIEVYPNFMWMTLGQIKKLMEIDNLVNMDARTVISGIPLVTVKMNENELEHIEKLFTDAELFKSIFQTEQCETLSKMYYEMNNYKMFQDVRISTLPLNQLVDWSIDDYGITSRKKASFMVRYYDIEISGREVQSWTQPLFKAIGNAIFGLITRKTEQGIQYLVRIKPEIGSFDRLELGPSIQWEPSHDEKQDDAVESFFRGYLGAGINVNAKSGKKSQTGSTGRKGIITDVLLSEEGGRFYHEQNRNVIIEITDKTLLNLPAGYFWTEYSTLNFLMQVNNCLNIQLRNLLSLLKI